MLSLLHSADSKAHAHKNKLTPIGQDDVDLNTLALLNGVIHFQLNGFHIIPTYFVFISYEHSCFSLWQMDCFGVTKL